MKKRKLATKRMNCQIRGMLRTNLLQNRRATIYKMMLKRHGFVPCFVCTEHVEEEGATVEHIISSSKGGTDDMSNLTISHEKCNNDRGDA